METSEILTIAVILLVPAAALWLLFLARTRPKSPARTLGIPKAMRPGEPDDVLEGPRLERIQVVGVAAVILTGAFVAGYWLPESDRQQAFVEKQEELSIERGSFVFAQPPAIEEAEGAGPEEFKEIEERIALGMNCVSCHGPEGTGGQVPGGFVDPVSGNRVEYTAPPLNNVFTRWDEEVVRFTIERGRPGTPMPAWGVEYGGPMTEQMVTDVIAWLRTLRGNQEPPPAVSENCQEPAQDQRVECGQEIFEARCAVCHGPEGQGKDADPYFPGLALWEGKARHLSTAQHILTVQNGRRFAFMPAFGENPPQGIPVAPYPLNDDQIRAVVEYERSL